MIFPPLGGGQATFQGPGDDNTNAFVSELNPSGGLVASTFLAGTTNGHGGNLNEGRSIALDSNVDVFVTGVTDATDFPTTTNAFQTTYGGGFTDAFVTKLNSELNAIIYSTYIGGAAEDEGNAITVLVNSSHYAYVGGATNSTDFPTTSGAFQTTFGGGDADGFFTEINPTPSTALVYSTYLGGSQFDAVYGIAHRFFSAYLTGETDSPGFPTTPGAPQTMISSDHDDAFVSRITPAGGGSSDLLFSTFIGGGGEDWGSGIAVDFEENIYVAGSTASNNIFKHSSLPYGGDFDAYALKLSPYLNTYALAYSTYLGGSTGDLGNGIAIEHTGFSEASYVAGESFSANFPVTGGVFQTALNGPSDAFVTKLVASIPPNHVLLYSINPTNSGVDVGGIRLKDRFQTKYNVNINGPLEIGNPANKFFDEQPPSLINDESLHYLTYFTSLSCPFAKRVTAVDQFTDFLGQRLTVDLNGTSRLMVPASKTMPPDPAPTELPDNDTHYRCYDATAKYDQNRGIVDEHGNFLNAFQVLLQDEFTNGDTVFYVIAPTRYCVAVEKTHNGVEHEADIQDNENAFMCYKVVPGGDIGSPFNFNALDQFLPKAVNFTTNSNLFTLCVPSIITKP